jgi:hypothetical protein
VHLAFSARLEAEDAEVLAVVGDLESYPQWLGLVQKVRADGDGWYVDLGARLGLLKGTKRVRMVRVESAAREVRFVRDEADGQDHPPWVLNAGVHDGELTVELDYGGTSLLVSLIEPALKLEASRAPARLQRLVSRRRAP